jgi:hypothetical protein
VPQEFIVTQSFGIIDKPETLNSLGRIARQIDMSDEAGSVVAEQIGTAKDELLASEALYGEHHLTVVPLVKRMSDLDAAITSIGAAMTDRAVLWVREDLNCEPAFWAQLPGNFNYVARRAIISSKNFAGFGDGGTLGVQPQDAHCTLRREHRTNKTWRPCHAAPSPTKVWKRSRDSSCDERARAFSKACARCSAAIMF